MNSERIKEIQEATGYPDSVSVQQALLKVWNECDQEYKKEVDQLKVELERLKGNASSCDDILQELEDYTHGALGDKITIARIKLKE